MRPERRLKRRYDINLRLRYSVIRISGPEILGEGNTTNISSCGLLFQCGGRLPAGAHIAVDIEWPSAADASTPLRLFLTGQVVRSQHSQAAVAIGRYDFRHDWTVRELKIEPVPQNETGRPAILIVDSDPVYRFFAAMLSRYHYPVMSSNIADAGLILQSGQPPVGLLITDRINDFAELPPGLLVIDTDFRGAEESASDLSGPAFRLRRPLRYGSVRAAIAAALQKFEKRVPGPQAAAG